MKKLLLVSVIAVAMIGCANQAQEADSPTFDSTVSEVVDTPATVVVVDTTAATIVDSTTVE